MLFVAAICVALLASVLLVNASMPQVASTPVDNGNYIVVFNQDRNLSSVMDDQVATFAAENDATVLYRYDLINGIAINVPGTDGAAKLRSLPGVKYVEKDITFHVTLDKAAPLIGAPQVWDLGLTGKGVTVALVDTGIDGTHPDLKGRITQWKDLVQNKADPYDDFGHGTHCAGIIGGNGAASNGKYKGVAPEVKFVGVKVLGKDGSGSLSNIISGIQFAAGTNASVISMSLGSNQHSQSMDDAVKAAVQKGKVMVIAAGNSGPGSNTIACPGDSPDVITVGATDKSDVIASFSSRGPNRDGSVKPDVSAPGKDIISCRATGTNDGKAIDTYYLSMSGTSMATPMVAGSVALMVQKKPGLTPADAKSILEKTAKQLGTKTPNNDYGYGRINVKAAIDYLSGNYTPTPTPSPSPSPSPSPRPSPTPTPTPGNPGYPYPGYPYPGYPRPTPTPNPGYPGYPGYPYPGYPGYPYPGYPGYPYPGYPYPGYPYPGYPGYED